MSQTLIYILGIVGIYLVLTREWLPFIIRLFLNVIVLHFIFQLMWIAKVDWDSLKKLMALARPEYWLTVIGITLALLLVRGIFFRMFGLAR